jgi:putative transposase
MVRALAEAVSLQRPAGAALAGGISDHIHIAIPPAVAVAKAVQLIKGASSRWVKDSLPKLSGFAWQDGYGAFTVSESQIDTVRTYIRNQAEHHRTKTFAEEYRALLERHQVSFDEHFVFD